MTDFMFVENGKHRPAVVQVELVSFNAVTRMFTCCNEQLNL
jgi:hypothetical protein